MLERPTHFIQENLFYRINATELHHDHVLALVKHGNLKLNRNGLSLDFRFIVVCETLGPLFANFVFRTRF